MFGSTIELITLIASNSLIIFCFCNLIIVSLLVGGLKPSSKPVRENPIPAKELLAQGNKNDSGEEGDETYSHDTRKAALEVSASRGENEINEETKNQGNVTDISEADDLQADSVIIENDDEEKHDDDELRKRVEEFIDRINMGWKAEKLRSSSVV